MLYACMGSLLCCYQEKSSVNIDRIKSSVVWPPAVRSLSLSLLLYKMEIACFLHSEHNFLYSLSYELCCHQKIEIVKEGSKRYHSNRIFCLIKSQLLSEINGVIRNNRKVTRFATNVL